MKYEYVYKILKSWGIEKVDTLNALHADMETSLEELNDQTKKAGLEFCPAWATLDNQIWVVDSGIKYYATNLTKNSNASFDLAYMYSQFRYVAHEAQHLQQSINYSAYSIGNDYFFDIEYSNDAKSIKLLLENIDEMSSLFSITLGYEEDYVEFFIRRWLEKDLNAIPKKYYTMYEYATKENKRAQLEWYNEYLQKQSA